MSLLSAHRMWLFNFGDVDEVAFYIFCAVASVVVLLAVANMLVGCFVDNYRLACIMHVPTPLTNIRAVLPSAAQLPSTF